jgi:hypothetical protein
MAMNAVMYGWNSVDDLKFALSKVPDMKGLELVLSFCPIFYGDEKNIKSQL